MKKIFSPLKCKQAPSYGSMASVWVHGEHCARHQSYLDGQSDVCISTKAASPVAGAVMETSSWGREKSTGPIKASRSAQVWRAPLFSTTITGNLKEAVIEFIAAYGNCYWSLEAQQWGYWYQNGTIQLLRECLKCRNTEGRREGVKIFEESEPFFQVRSCSPCLLPRHPEIHSTAAWSEIWTTVQRWSRRIWLAVICVDGWKCPQPWGKTAWTQTFLPSFTPLKIVWKPPTLKKKKGAVLCISEYRCWKQRVDWACLSSVPYDSDWSWCGKHFVLGWSITSLSHRGRRDPLCQRCRHFCTEIDWWEEISHWGIVHRTLAANLGSRSLAVN